jgi:hypothetical protein
MPTAEPLVEELCPLYQFEAACALWDSLKD